jgi:hypothetical protein
MQRTNTENWKQIFPEKEYINGLFVAVYYTQYFLPEPLGGYMVSRW